jgi:hypothetical protein
MLVDADLWLCVLDFALLQGWRPRGTKAPDSTLCRRSEHSLQWEPLAYFLPHGQTIDAADARDIARFSSTALPHVSDTEVPLQGKAFGDENTLSLLRLAASREDIPKPNTEAAFDILSGPPKQEALALIRFLKCGHITIRPEVEPR